MLEVRRVVIVAVVLTLALGVLPRQGAYAANTCNVTISPDSISPGTESALQFDIQNTGSTAAAWIQVQRPSVSYSVNGITQSGWTDATNDDGTTLTDATLGPAATFSLQLAMFTAPQEEGASSWSVMLSPNSDGSGAYACGGQTDTSITTPPQPPTPNGESNVHLTSITATTATVAWNSDSASTSYVYYGIDTSYGKIATVSGSSTTHSVPLTGLSPSTIYHYMVAGSNDQGDSLFSVDNTFVTPAAPPPVPPPTIITSPSQIITSLNGSQANVPGVTIAPTPTEFEPPTVTLTTTFAQPFDASPVISGRAQDNAAVARVEYSIDGGRNWLPVDKVVADTVRGSTGAGVTFRFTPILIEDGNYSILARAIDSSGNVGATAPATLVIDRLPPQLGPLQITTGAQVLSPSDQTGAIDLVAGVDYRVTGGAVGGPTQMSLEARADKPTVSTGNISQEFTLTQNPETGLWGGAIRLQHGGAYTLTSYSVDGADNRTTRQVLKLAVAAAGLVRTAESSKPISGAKITLYYFEPSSSTWQLWDGAPYDQTNPAIATAYGGYSFVVPSGRYYIRVSAAGYKTWTSHIFSLKRTAAITPELPVAPRTGITLGSFRLELPDFALGASPLPASTAPASALKDPLIGQALPDFNLPIVGGGQRREIELEGRPTVLTIVSTWAPTTTAQLTALAKAQANHDVNAPAIFIGEKTALVGSYIGAFGRPVQALADPDGELIAPLHVSSLPRHIFVDRTGHVKKVMLGVLSDTEILNQLGGL